FRCSLTLPVSKLSRPTTSTLFPYTTLFRSRGSEGREERVDHDAEAARGADERDARDHETGRPARPVRARRHDLSVVVPHDRADEDRKSTRLNSSHVKISYAVFCLKKKSMQK